MARPSDERKRITERVMHEWKRDEPRNSACEPVTDRRQAVAIALNESRSSDRQTPAQNRRRRKQTERKDARGETGRQLAKGDPTKAELEQALKEG